ncbi:hypothetical protein LAZ67_5004353 [Cordylochernes scorpioides]|uniref:Ankyrin repeat protein n=1 Tax=Cordylochernes scorpioides TaxID=51811 RepID=A0ABY6KKW0_9ARAC|nr:hypothetical protein LAZ67_5004353 [Cordylochernes scorpioides]
MAELVGIDVDLQSEDGSTPLHIAAMKGNIDIISDLLDAGADIDAKRKNGETTIYIAIKKGNLELFELLLEAGANINLEYEFSRTCLHMAIDLEFKYICEKLIEKGADIEARDQFGLTPLIWAAANANIQCFIEIILEKGADVNARNMHGSSALYFASVGSVANVRVLLKAGADINVRNENGMTCLMRAADANKEDILIELLKRGANIHDTDKNGLSAFSYACMNNNISIVKTLIDLGSKLDKIDFENILPMDVASIVVEWNGQDTTTKTMKRELMHVLIEAGADANIKIANSYLPSTFLAHYMYLNIIIMRETWTREMQDITETLMEIADFQLEYFLKNIDVMNIEIILPCPLLKIMVKYYVLQDLQLKKPNSIVSVKELSEWWDECRDQVNKMQNHVLGKSSVNLRKYLNERDPNIRAHLLFKAGIITQDRIEVEISLCHKNFPIYAELIHNRFNQDLKRGRILYSWNFITINNKFGKLNNLIRSKIGEQLTNRLALEHVKPSG